jgi:hypothetical protein
MNVMIYVLGRLEEGVDPVLRRKPQPGLVHP